MVCHRPVGAHDTNARPIGSTRPTPLHTRVSAEASSSKGGAGGPTGSGGCHQLVPAWSLPGLADGRPWAAAPTCTPPAIKEVPIRAADPSSPAKRPAASRSGPNRKEPPRLVAHPLSPPARPLSSPPPPTPSRCGQWEGSRIRWILNQRGKRSQPASFSARTAPASGSDCHSVAHQGPNYRQPPWHPVARRARPTWRLGPLWGGLSRSPASICPFPSLGAPPAHQPLTPFASPRSVSIAYASSSFGLVSATMQPPTPIFFAPP